MGTSASSLLHQHPARRRGYELLPGRPDDEEEKQEEFIFFKEEKQGPAALEARGLMLRHRAERRQGTVSAIRKDLKDAALCYLAALNWRKAGTAFAQQALYDLDIGDGPGAATALLRSAKCYVQMEHKNQNQLDHVEEALEMATELFVKGDDLELAAASCLELAEFYMDRQDLRSALDRFKEAADYSHRAGHLECWRHCGYKANLVRHMLRKEGAPRREGVYKTRSAGYIRSSDPDWRLRVSELYLSTTHRVVVRPGVVG
ncbi:unnamed protein product [Alopecurus aequalis]